MHVAYPTNPLAFEIKDRSIFGNGAPDKLDGIGHLFKITGTFSKLP